MTERMTRKWQRLNPAARIPLLILLAVSAAQPITVASETNTVSKPAGFVRLTIPTNSEILVSIPCHAFDPAVNSLFSSQLTGATNESMADTIRKWAEAGRIRGRPRG